MNNQCVTLDRKALESIESDIDLKSLAKNEGIAVPTTIAQGTIHSRKDAVETAALMLTAGWGLDRVSAQTNVGLKKYLTIREYSKLSLIPVALVAKPCDEGRPR